MRKGVIVTLLMSDGNSNFLENNPMEMSEAVLISMAKSGDTDAFVALSRRHSTRILQTICRITRNWQDAEDALQDSLLKAFSHLKEFQGKSSFSTWLTRIAINSALMILRKKRHYYEISIDDINGIEESRNGYEWRQVKSNSEDPERRLARKEREELLRNTILGLSPVLREVVELRQARDFSVQEISQTLGISVPAVKSRLARARVTLRAALLSSD
jgi:RNA polymerase sigma-70 factor, ECF subfamily